MSECFEKIKSVCPVCLKTIDACKTVGTDGLIYMDNIESRFEQFNWINSHTALKKIEVNGKCLLTGADMPHHEKIVMSVK